MNSLKRLALLAILAFGLICIPGIAPTDVSAQGRQDFILVNKTGVEIYALYVTPHNSDDWGEDILGIDTLAANEDVEITFSRREKAKLWDLRVEDESGDFIEWENLNLLTISRVTLFFKNGNPTAIVE